MPSLFASQDLFFSILFNSLTIFSLFNSMANFIKKTIEIVKKKINFYVDKCIFKIYLQGTPWGRAFKGMNNPGPVKYKFATQKRDK